MTQPNPRAVQAHNAVDEAEAVAEELMDTDPLEAWDRALDQIDESLASRVRDSDKPIDDIIFELLVENLLDTGDDPR